MTAAVRKRGLPLNWSLHLSTRQTAARKNNQIRGLVSNCVWSYVRQKWLDYGAFFNTTGHDKREVLQWKMKFWTFLWSFNALSTLGDCPDLTQRRQHFFHTAERIEIVLTENRETWESPNHALREVAVGRIVSTGSKNGDSYWELRLLFWDIRILPSINSKAVEINFL